jgi:nondiscriminating glutamyl-tRNA synthetase
MNAQSLHHASGATLDRWAGAFLPEAARALPAARRQALLEAVRGNLSTLSDLARELEPFVEDRLDFEAEARAALEAPRARELCESLAGALDGLAEWSGEQVKSAVQSLGRSMGLKGRELFQPVRAALTGRTHGPQLPLIAELLGRERCAARLRAAFQTKGDR